MLECLAGALLSAAATSSAGWLLRRRLLHLTFGNEALVAELSHRGFDIQHHALEQYVCKNYRVLSKLGEGRSAEVMKVVKRDTSEVFAMKCIKKSPCNGDSQLRTEIECLRKLRHRHIVNLTEVVESDQYLWIVMECAKGGGLYDRILQLEHFSEQSAARVLKQVLKAVHYMHGMGVVHRDLKPENILLDSTSLDADVKVADFGLAAELGFDGYHPEESMHLKQSSMVSGPFVGSPISMAPEVSVKDAQYGPQCDIWSIGCLAHELLSGHPPFTASSVGELFEVVRKSEGPRLDDEVWANVSVAGKDLVRQLLQKRPEDRPSAKEALTHLWFLRAPDSHMRDSHAVLCRRATAKLATAPSPLSARWLPHAAPPPLS